MPHTHTPFLRLTLDVVRIRQIGRWNGVAGDKGRWKSNLVAKCLISGKSYDDASVSPVVRQTLLHWAYQLSAADFESGTKRVSKNGAAYVSTALTKPLGNVKAEVKAEVKAGVKAGVKEEVKVQRDGGGQNLKRGAQPIDSDGESARSKRARRGRT